MALDGGIDVHANNSLMALLDAHDQVVAEQRLPNDLHTILASLAPYHAELTGLVVESTYHWYGRVDGLCEAGDRVHLAHTAAIKQYAGLKLSNDQVDARWLVHLLRVDILPEGDISPKGERAVRAL
jgi:transposase